MAEQSKDYSSCICSPHENNVCLWIPAVLMTEVLNLEKKLPDRKVRHWETKDKDITKAYVFCTYSVPNHICFQWLCIAISDFESTKKRQIKTEASPICTGIDLPPTFWVEQTKMVIAIDHGVYYLLN